MDRNVTDAQESLCRLCLVTPSGVAPEAFAAILEEALSGNDVASLIITADRDDLASLAKGLVPIAQANGVAALIHNDARIAEITGADGVHIDDRVLVDGKIDFLKVRPIGRLGYLDFVEVNNIFSMARPDWDAG